ncbi:hypothetical protein UlMin_005085 [Ulmus minor]
MATSAAGSTAAASSSETIGASQSSSLAPASGSQFFNHNLHVKLDRSNYVLWRSQMDNVIYANGFENFIEGLSVCPEKTDPTTGAVNPEFVAWRRQDRLLLSWIYSSLTPEIMAQIVGHTTSNSAWNALEKIFSSSSRARIMQLRLQLQTTKKNSMSMIDFIMKIKGFCDSLAAIGELVSEQDQIMNLLAGLGSDYNVVVTSISARDSQLSLESVHSLLLTFEHRLEQQNSFDDTGVIAANLAQNNKNAAAKNYGKNSQGYQKSSNQSSRGRGGQTGRNNSNTSKPQCQLCGKFGHTVQNCYHRFNITFQAQQSTENSQAQNPMSAMVATPNTVADESWYLDSGATHHMTQNASTLSNSTPYNEFYPKHFIVKDQRSRQVLVRGRIENGLYKLPLTNLQESKNNSAFLLTKPLVSVFSASTDNSTVWHDRLGHVSSSILQKILSTCNVSCSVNKDLICSSCQYAKSHRLPFPISHSRASSPLELVHTDTWGPAPLLSTSGARYFILFVDNHTRFTWLFPLQTKDQALKAFIQYKILAENQFNGKIKAIQSDNGGEFKVFARFLQSHGIAHRFSCPYTSAQNGRVERKHGHVVETGLALLARASLPLKYWLYAFQTAVFLINRMPTKILDFSSPYSTLLHKSPDYNMLKIFGCLCYPFIRPFNKHKMQYRSVQCAFIGYSSIHKGYLCLDYHTRRVYVTCHVIFYESKFPFASQLSPAIPVSDQPILTPTPAIVNFPLRVPAASVSQPTPPALVLAPSPAPLIDDYSEHTTSIPPSTTHTLSLDSQQPEPISPSIPAP